MFEGNHKIPFYQCQCGYKPTMTATSDGSAPKDGDASVCFKCGKVTVFSSDGSQREMTEADEARYKERPEDWEMLMEVRDLVLSKNMI